MKKNRSSFTVREAYEKTIETGRGYKYTKCYLLKFWHVLSITISFD